MVDGLHKNMHFKTTSITASTNLVDAIVLSPLGGLPEHGVYITTPQMRLAYHTAVVSGAGVHRIEFSHSRVDASCTKRKMGDVSAMIGLKVRIKMAAPLTDEHDGDIFAYDDKNGTVAIRESSPCPRGACRPFFTDRLPDSGNAATD